MYRAGQLPEPRRTTDRWRSEAVRLGVGEPYLCAVESTANRPDPTTLGFDAAVQFAPDFSDRSIRPGVVVRGRARILRPHSPFRRSRVVDYSRRPRPWRRDRARLHAVSLRHARLRQHRPPARRGRDHPHRFLPRGLRAMAATGGRRLQPRSPPRRTWCSSTPGTSGPRATTSSPASDSVGATWRRTAGSCAGRRNRRRRSHRPSGPGRRPPGPGRRRPARAVAGTTGRGRGPGERPPAPEGTWP